MNASYSFVLTPYERTLAERRRRDSLVTSSEEDFARRAFERMRERPDLEAMLAGIDYDLMHHYGMHPHQVARYGSREGVLQMLRPHHNQMADFHMHYTYFMDALLFRERVWRGLRHIVALKRFAMRVSASFLERYYSPPWGRGARRALRRLKAGI